MRVFLVRAGGDAVLPIGELMGYGIEFPSGQVAVDWNLRAFPPEDRLENPHLSLYGSVEDMKQATGGTIRTVFDDADGDVPASRGAIRGL